MEQPLCLSGTPKLKDLLEKTSSGEACPCFSITLRNIAGDEYRNETWERVVEQLAEQRNIDKLKLLVLFNQRLNSDQVLRMGKAPEFRRCIGEVMQSCGFDMNEHSPEDLFECPSDCYDVSEFTRLRADKQARDELLQRIHSSIDTVDNNDAFYDELCQLQDKYHSADEEMTNNIRKIEGHCEDYEPSKYNQVFNVLGRTPRSYYFKRSSKEDTLKQADLGRLVSKNADRSVPKYPHIVAISTVHLRDIIRKHLRGCQTELMDMRENDRENAVAIEDVLKKIKPPSSGFLSAMESVLQQLSSGMDFSSDDSDDEEDEEDELEKRMKEIFQSANEGEQEQEQESAPSPAWEFPEDGSDQGADKKTDEEDGGESDKKADEETNEDQKTNEIYELSMASPKAGGSSFF
tara:strand:+ start:3135 stop:4349 length:1215 start_codon:yes stop_codon:yes gene_type:complete